MSIPGLISMDEYTGRDKYGWVYLDGWVSVWISMDEYTCMDKYGWVYLYESVWMCIPGWIFIGWIHLNG